MGMLQKIRTVLGGEAICVLVRLGRVLRSPFRHGQDLGNVKPSRMKNGREGGGKLGKAAVQVSVVFGKRGERLLGLAREAAEERGRER